jgi:hypothetical protein
MSRLFPCKNCEQKVAQNARLCPNCGIKEPAPAEEILLKIIALYCLIGYFFILPYEKVWFGGETSPALWVWSFYISWNFCVVWIFFNITKKYL